MKKFLLYFILFSIIIPYFSAFGWSNSGHEIIATIAYHRLNPATKNKIDRITKIMFHSRNPFVRFLKASKWPDMIEYHDITAFKHWHYIAYGYSSDGTPTKPPDKYNVAWAIGQSFKVLASPRSNLYEKAWFLNFLVHFVGDAHQPLHCIRMYSKKFPDSDFSGNLFLIHSDEASNLHQFWDRGAGIFSRKRLTLYKLKKLANAITKEYPPSYFGKKVNNMDPWRWTKNGFQLAKQYAYQIKLNSIPSKSYVKMSQKIIKQQIALAGYRLANMLNIAFSKGGNHS